MVKQGFHTPWTQSLIIPIFESGDKNDPSNYWTIMISLLLAKLYCIILEKNISEWLEMEGKRVKGQAGLRRNHLAMDHLITLRIIAKECRNNESDLFCCFVDFIKAFDTLPRSKPMEYARGA